MGAATPAPQLAEVHACLQKLGEDHETWIPVPVLSRWVRLLRATGYVAYNLEEATLQNGCDGQEPPWLCFVLCPLWVLTR